MKLFETNIFVKLFRRKVFVKSQSKISLLCVRRAGVISLPKGRGRKRQSGKRDR